MVSLLEMALKMNVFCKICSIQDKFHHLIRITYLCEEFLINQIQNYANHLILFNLFNGNRFIGAGHWS